MRRARRAGLGDVGRAMEIIMFGQNLQESAQHDADEPRQPSRSDSERRGRSRTRGAENDSDGESVHTDDSTSEREWEGWEGDLLSRRARRDISDEVELNWATSWVYAANGLTASPTSEYIFPSSSTGLEQESTASPPPKTLSSYSSADSLLRRTIKRASPRKRRPVPSRSDSPSVAGRIRPRSPLADLSDYDDEQADPRPPVLLGRPHPQAVYASRHSSFESSSASRTTYLPISMAMTTITSTVSVGAEAVQDRKGKGKAKQRDKGTPRPTRRRSSTVQALPGVTAQSTQAGSSQPGPLQQQASQIRPDVAGSSASSSGRHDGEKNDAKHGRLKLSLSFAQVAALGTLTASSGRMPSSSASESSFESPRFARPEDSD